MNTTSPMPPDTPAVSLAPAPWIVAQTVVAEAGLDGQTLLLGSRAERAFEPGARQRLLYVVAGSVTATQAPTHYMLAADATLVIPAKHTLTVRNHTDSPAKLLLLTLPPPQIEWRVTPPQGG